MFDPDEIRREVLVQLQHEAPLTTTVHGDVMRVTLARPTGDYVLNIRVSRRTRRADLVRYIARVAQDAGRDEIRVFRRGKHTRIIVGDFTSAWGKESDTNEPWYPMVASKAWTLNRMTELKPPYPRYQDIVDSWRQRA